MSLGYKGVSVGERQYRKLLSVVNNLLKGKMNVTGVFTLRANQTTTEVLDVRCGSGSVVLFVPQSASAAGAIATTYISEVITGSFTFAHVDDAGIDRHFSYILIG
ncbi:MAG: hypothetical protein ACTSXQ_00305 [Alphaproteobacteria bacterium]